MEGLRHFFYLFFNLKHTGDGDSRQRVSSFGQIQILLGGANYVEGGGSLTGVMVSGQSIESARAVRTCHCLPVFVRFSSSSSSRRLMRTRVTKRAENIFLCIFHFFSKERS